MPDLVIDTQIAVWYFQNSPLLSNTARNALNKATAKGENIFLSAISIVEIIYLIEKGRLVEQTLTILSSFLRSPDSSFVVQNLNSGIAEALREIPRSIVPDMPDRIIAATALNLGLPLLTSDSAIRKLKNIKTIW